MYVVGDIFGVETLIINGRSSLCVTSVASERAFSSAGLDNDKRRGKISANTFGSLQFVKAHCKEKRRWELMAEKVMDDTQRVIWTNM